MSINIKTDRMQAAVLFHRDILFTHERIPEDDVPEGWYRYEIRGSVRNARKATAISEYAYVNRIGSILSPVPLMRERTISRRVNGQFLLLGGTLTLREYCQNNGLPFPIEAPAFTLRPASPEEAGLFYSQTPEKDAELGAIGHVRIDFGSGGKEFWHTWWPRGPEEWNTPEFRAELDAVVNDLRKGVLKDLASMRLYCHDGPGAIAGGACCQNYGFTVETERYLFRLRCNPIEGDYQAYLSCFDKQVQQMDLTESGLQRLKNAADPALPHSYEWYVMEACNTPEERLISGLTLEEAIRHYAASRRDGRRLGVTKDGIAAVDLVIQMDGRMWLSRDRLKLDAFKDDPVVAEAAVQLQHMLDERPAVGRVTFASGETWSFTNLRKYLQTIHEEMPHQSATGFRCETLSADPEVHKAVDDVLCCLHGEEDPHRIEETNMTMGGM